MDKKKDHVGEGLVCSNIHELLLLNEKPGKQGIYKFEKIWAYFAQERVRGLGAIYLGRWYVFTSFIHHFYGLRVFFSTLPIMKVSILNFNNY